MARQAERRAATRAKLVSAARKRFAQDGYEGTHTGDILTDTGLSRGALYHHFPSKQALFEAVFVDVSEESIKRAVELGPRGTSALENLIGACLAWVNAVRQPDIATLLLDEGPGVLGWKRARDLEAKSSLSVMKRGLARAVEAGEVQVSSLELTARLINAVLAEAALARLHRGRTITKRDQEKTIRQFIEGLRRPA